MSFPRYPKYKDSGVEWLGQVPEHWEVCALKRIVKLQSGESITAEAINETGDYPVFGGNGLRGYTSDFTHDGNFVLVGRQGALCGNVNYATGTFWASEHALVASPVKPVATIWLGEMLRAMNLNQYSISAAQPGLSVDLVGNISTVRPPSPEQTAIASFLDQETAKIDALVAEQQRLIELLKEKRQAVISHAVTKGLNPKAPMKPSGIEWLGDVPEHWKVTPLKHIASLKGRLGWQGLRADEYTEDGPFLVTSEHFAEDRIEWHRCYHVSLDRYGTAPEIQLHPNDLLMMKDGAAMGKLAFVDSLPGPACLNSHLLLFRPLDGQFVNRFLYYVLGGPFFRTYMLRERKGSTFFGISQESIGAFPFAVPPIDEQSNILEFLNKETDKFDALTTVAQRAIDLLQERRTALISAAVTGQIDVRPLTGKKSV